MSNEKPKKPVEEKAESLRVTMEDDGRGGRRVRMIADKVTLTVNELVIAAGSIKVVRHPEIPTEGEAEVIFDELNADEFTMRYAD